MCDLAKDLLTQYYGIGTELSGKKFLSIHQSVQNAKNEEEKEITEQTTLINNEEDISDEEFQEENDGSRKPSVANESQLLPSQALNSIDDAFESDENFDLFDIDFGPNVMCNAFENASSFETPEAPSGDATSDCIKTKIGEPEIEIIGMKENGSSLTCIEDAFSDNASECSSTISKKPRKSSSSINLPLLVRKKEPVCNETFADFSNTDLKQFPNEILYNFSQLKMLYLSNNDLMEIPDEVFSFLKYLEWFDVRNNRLSSLPSSIKGHKCLETILLQGNRVENLPLELCTLPNLRTLHVTQNPLVTPPKDVVASGCAAILEFLRFEWNNAHPEERVEPKENKIEPKLSTILCYQCPSKNKKKTVRLQDSIRNRNESTREKRKFYKPSNRCESKGANVLMEHRLLWFSKLKELFCKETSKLQKIKDENVLKEWRRNKRSYSKSMENAMKRNEEDIPFGFDIEDYASIFKRNSKPKKLGSRKKQKQKFIPPTDINKKINELLESLNKLEINTVDETTPRTKQSLFKNEIEKILQFQNEIQNLQKYNDIATVPIKN
ncbi:unnamed protein product [Xylocopa violacea]|uniref:Leucine-rich repeat-containing protein 27 n=1 Tax=Xylocopa violacea TaxID=135666 RepID=A0ABP1NF95_XYLVO